MKKIYVLALAAASLAAQTVSAHATAVSGALTDSGIDIAQLSLEPADQGQYSASLYGGGLGNVVGYSDAVGTIFDIYTPFSVTENATITPISGTQVTISNGTFTRSYNNLNEGSGWGTLSGTFSGKGDLKTLHSLPFLDYSADVVITGGTGVFAGFEGTGSLGGFATFNGAVETFRDNATISAVPLPGSIAMFGSALVGLIGLGRRKAILNSAA